MFLALKEILYSKTRYILIITVMILVTYLVMFLTGLAYGLAQDNRMAVDAWDATAIVLTDESNSTVAMSQMKIEKTEDISAKEKAIIGVSPMIIYNEAKGMDKKTSVYIFGTEQDSFVAPNIIEGKMNTASNEVVADQSLRDEYDYKIGDTLSMATMESSLEIVGFTENKKFSAAPVLYVSIEDFQAIARLPQDSGDNGIVSAIVTRGETHTSDSALDVISIEAFINDLPGYRPQVLTFGLMISFLIVISAFVLGIFMYVLTVQKTAMFGVMKAQGIANGVIARSVIAQTFILTAIGVFIGFLLTFITSLFLPVAVPFQIQYIFMLGIVLLLFLFAIIGGLFSVRSATKVDALVAMGG